MAKKILVTGSAGFIGHWVAQALVERGDQVVGIDNFNDYYDVRLKKDRAKNLAQGCPTLECDLGHYEKLESIFNEGKFDQVCHLAAQAGVRYSLENPFVYEHSNNLGTLNLLELCRRKKIASFVFASSSSVYGGNTKIPFSENDPVNNPISLYAATKRSNELTAYTYHHLYGIHVTALRFFTVYGPWGRPDMAYFKFTQAILNNKPIDVYNNGKMKRDFTYISDIVPAVLSALDKNLPFEIFNLGNSEAIDLIDFIGCIEKELGKKAQKNFLAMQPGDLPVTSADIRKARKLLGFSPQVKVGEGIKEFVKWYLKYKGN